MAQIFTHPDYKAHMSDAFQEMMKNIAAQKEQNLKDAIEYLEKLKYAPPEELHGPPDTFMIVDESKSFGKGVTLKQLQEALSENKRPSGREKHIGLFED